MAHYEERLHADIEAIRRHVLDMARAVNANLDAAVHALLHLDKANAYECILNDFPINRQSRALDQLCHGFVARHLPSAGHLRFISSVLRMNVSIERIGDYAVTISRLTTQLSKAPTGDVRREMEHLAEDSFQMFSQALQAFKQDNEQLARSTRQYASTIERDFTDAFSELVQLGDSNEVPTQELFALLTILNRLERVSDHAKNLCEYIDFALTGQTKPPKIYRVLFLETKDDCAGPLAVAYARKAFGHVGEFESAGLDPSTQSSPACLSFLEDLGHDTTALAPRTFGDTATAPRDYHVVISLDRPMSDYIDPVPFHTIALEWHLPSVPSDKTENGVNRWKAIYEELASRISELMMTIRGKEGLS